MEHPFHLAINYFEDKDKEELLNIRRGIYSLDQIDAILEAKYKRTLAACEEYYSTQKPNEELLEWVIEKLKKIVKDNI